jgi:hypothetical protein
MAYTAKGRKFTRNETGRATGKGRQNASRNGNRYLKKTLMTAASSVTARRIGNNALTRRWQANLAAGMASSRLRRNLARKIAVLVQYLLRSKEQYNDERVATTQ